MKVASWWSGSLKVGVQLRCSTIRMREPVLPASSVVPYAHLGLSGEMPVPNCSSRTAGKQSTRSICFGSGCDGRSRASTRCPRRTYCISYTQRRSGTCGHRSNGSAYRGFFRNILIERTIKDRVDQTCCPAPIAAPTIAPLTISLATLPSESTEITSVSAQRTFTPLAFT